MVFSLPSSLSVSFSRTADKPEPAARPAPQAEQPVSPAPPHAAAPAADDAGERRQHQRFMAQRQGEACFWIVLGEQRIALNDLSLKGFSLPAIPDYAVGTQFDFTLQRDGVPDTVRGRARVVNQLGQGDAVILGCSIVQFEGDDAGRLQEWLVTHVICSATVRITEKDAAAIVAGRPLI
jgi:hypothetical protein